MHFFGFFKTQECKTDHSQGIPGHRSPAAAAYTNVLVRMLLQNCNGDTRKTFGINFLNTYYDLLITCRLQESPRQKYVTNNFPRRPVITTWKRYRNHDPARLEGKYGYATLLKGH